MNASTSEKRVLIMAGGTGGHVFPGLAVADELRLRGHQVSWLGTASGIEARLVPAADIKLHVIDIAGVRGKGIKGLLAAPYRIVHAIMQSLRILSEVKPDCVLGMGGFAGGPGAVAAKIKGIPLVIHEQNAVAGTTNKILAPVANRVLQAFPGAFTKSKRVSTVGNPVRKDITASTVLAEDEKSPLNLLVLGGSLGAKAVNEIMPGLIAAMSGRIAIRHQTGARHIDDVAALYRESGLSINDKTLTVAAFIENMAEAYAWADVVVCRSGAMTVSEVAVAQLPAIFIPFPYAIDDHQTANARWMVDAGAAYLMPQNEMTVVAIQAILDDLIAKPEALLMMKEKAAAIAIDNAAAAVADVCLELAS